MAKAMAKIENSVVVNVEWCSDRTSETDILKNIEDRLIEVGDTYAEGFFYRDGEKIMSTSEKLEDAENALSIILGGDVT